MINNIFYKILILDSAKGDHHSKRGYENDPVFIEFSNFLKVIF